MPAKSAAAPAAAQAIGAPPAGLLAAARARDAEAATRLLSTALPDEEKDAEGRTALALAVQRGDARMLALLVARGADPLLPDRQGRTPLALAQALGDAAVLQAVLQALKRP